MPGKIELTQYIPSLVAVGALSLFWYDLKRFKNNISDKFEKLQKEIRTSLYSQDGVTKYVPRSDCEKNAHVCQSRICGKIEEVKTAVAKSDSEIKSQLIRMDEKREKTKDELQKKFESIYGEYKSLYGEIHAERK